MSFNPRALAVMIAFMAILALAVNQSTLGLFAIGAALLIEASMWRGIFSRR